MPNGNEAAPSSGPPTVEGEPDNKKRSGAIFLVLMANFGVLVYQTGGFEHFLRGEEVRVYPDLQACLGGHLRSASDCRNGYETALNLYPRVMPEYNSFSECEIVHGASTCRFDPRERPPSEDKAVPAMAGFVVGLTHQQNLLPQPVFGSGCNGPDVSRDRDDFRYITGSEALLETPAGAGSVVAYGNPEKLRAEPDTLRKAVLGGFGKTGRTCIHRSSSGG